MDKTLAQDYPNGALRAWCTVIGSSLIQFVATGAMQSFGVFQDYYTMTFLADYTASQINWIGSIQVCFELTLSSVGGKLYDAGYCRMMLSGASLLFTFSYFMLSLAQKGQYYQVFLAQGIGLGINMGCLFTPACTLVSQHFKSNNALAMGIVMAGGPFGATIYSLMLNYLLNSGIGFAWSVRAVALLSAFCLLVGNVMITVPPIPSVPFEERKTSLKSMRDWPYLLTVISGIIMMLGSYFPVYFVQLYASRHGVSKTLTFYSISIINLSGMFARISAGIFAKRLGAINLSIISCALNGIGLYGMLWCNTPLGLVLFSICFGAFFGSTIFLFLPVVAYLAPSDADLGKVMGYAWCPAGIAALIGPPLAAALLGSDYIWWRGVVFVSICYILTAALQLVAKQIYAYRIKQNWAQRRVSLTMRRRDEASTP